MTLRFPHEQTVRDDIQHELRDYLNFAKRLRGFWLGTNKDRGLNESELAPVVKRVVLAMNVKACRQFRTVIELCERAESVDASVIARSMFESAQVVQFVLKPRFIPRRFNNQRRETSRIVFPGRRLTREFRATLFVTHHVLYAERTAARYKDTPGMKRFAKRLHALASRDGISDPYTTAIGPEWTNTLKSYPFTYSGLNIRNLSHSLGRPFPEWYDQVYGPQSDHVHAGDLMHHLAQDSDGDTTPSWHESVDHVCGCLTTGIAMFFTTVGLMNEHIDFGVAMNTALHEFSKEYRIVTAD